MFRPIKNIAKLAGVALAVMLIFAAYGEIAFAQSGHFITSGRNAPLCIAMFDRVTCSGKVAGLGGTTFEITVEATGVASVECENPGGNIAPGQDTEIMVTGSTDPLPTPKNGQYNFTVTTDPTVVPNFPTCPNPQWTAHVVEVEFGDATLTLYEDGVQVDQVIVPVKQ
jgi:hypothetical protein